MKKLTKLFVSLFILTVLLFSISACAKKVTVTFDANGGIVSPITCQYQIDKEYTLPTPIKQGYNFIKWQHDGKDVASSGVWSITEEATLKAVWEAKTYNVTLKYTDDEGEKTQTIDVVYGEQVSFVEPTKVGHTFAGWYYGNKLVSNGTWQVDGEKIVLEGKFEANAYTITFNLKGGSFSEQYKGLKKITLKYGQAYDFNVYGAYNNKGETDPDWYVKFSDGTLKPILSIGIWTITEDVTIEAHWGEYLPAV